MIFEQTVTYLQSYLFTTTIERRSDEVTKISEIKAPCKRTHATLLANNSQHYWKLLLPFARSLKFDRFQISFAQQLLVTRNNM